MTDKYASRRKVAVSTLLLGTLLALLVSALYQPRADMVAQSRMVRDVFDLSPPDQPGISSNFTLEPRGTYQCGSGKPCSNGACCGASGYCGYGPTYCGKGCSSNCKAVAQCGKYAATPNTKCPLNTCCSEFGFCGTTSDFCGKGCQSNCVLNPTPPKHKSGQSILDNRVIGYYESWSAGSKCHQIKPLDLPLDALTHINFAFAYIDPKSYEIVTMDSSTPSSLFSDITNVKSVKPELSVFISVGGWSFSDDKTVTQPIYGEIAADAGKRQEFANNVVKFMRQYALLLAHNLLKGFDGLDIDWEYPGAPDRGGHEDDIKNYVLLMQTLRKTFDASGGKYGLTFTTPSSFWYLRWFDLPNLMKYADWTNFMSYDLHGAWDATNPIGSIVQGHTNLTEIKLAAELFWRVGISPADIVLGFGFYGRAFTLADPSCTTLGRPFSGAAKPGPCTASGGTLAYYEILDIVKDQKSSISPIHDTVDAVMYFTFDKNQWVSYDNEVTFQQKVDWADSVGLGGAMIWASDLDDDNNTAHTALLGRKIVPTTMLEAESDAANKSKAIISSLASGTGQNCFAYTGKCVQLDDSDAMQAACGAGNSVVGWDDAGCGKKSCHCGKPICCPTNEAPKQCSWRGNDNGSGASSDCDGQCAAGEINIKGISSSWGGGFTNDGNTNKCSRGFKVFCCPDPAFLQLTQGCSYTGCRASCPTGETALFQTGAGCLVGKKTWCCPNPTSLTDCHWVTKTRSSGVDSDCANSVCNATELEVLRANGGEDVRCAYGRKQAACCSVQAKPVTPATCSYNLCRDPGYCTNNGASGIAQNRRGLLTIDPTPAGSSPALEKRGQDEYRVILAGGIEFFILAATVNSISELFASPNANQILRTQFRLRPGTCIGPTVDLMDIAAGPNPPGLQGDQTEHPLEPQLSALFLQTITQGRLRGNIAPPNGLQPIDSRTIDYYWNHPLHNLENQPAIGGRYGAKPLTANDRMMGAFGSKDWPFPLMAVDQEINSAKGRMFSLKFFTAEETLELLADQATTSDDASDADALLQHIRIAYAVFEYMNNPEFITRWTAARNQVRTQLGYIEAAFAARGWNVNGITEWWDVFLDDHLRRMEAQVFEFVDDAIEDAYAAYMQVNNRLPPGQTLNTWPSVQATLDAWRSMINNRNQGLTFPAALYSATIPLPQPPGGSGGGGSGGSGSGGSGS